MQVNFKKMTNCSVALNGAKNSSKDFVCTKDDDKKNDVNKKALSLICLGALGVASIALIAKGKHKIKPEKLQNLPKGTVVDGKPIKISPEDIKPKSPPGTNFKFTSLTQNSLERHLKGVDLTDPKAVEEALRKIPGVEIVEGSFKPSVSIKSGRKQYITINGERAILEVHTDANGNNPVMRLYENIPGRRNANLRDYLFLNGVFRNNAFFSPLAHIQTGTKGINWINDGVVTNTGVNFSLSA